MGPSARGRAAVMTHAVSCRTPPAVQGVGLKRQYDVLRHVAYGGSDAHVRHGGGGGGSSAASRSGSECTSPTGFLSAAAAAAAGAGAAGFGGAAAAGPSAHPAHSVHSQQQRHPHPQAAAGGGGGTCVRPFLPFEGVCTDGSCDVPWADFWVRGAWGGRGEGGGRGRGRIGERGAGGRLGWYGVAWAVLRP